jgi:hypothetical protein
MTEHITTAKQLICNQQVIGSNPIAGSGRNCFGKRVRCADDGCCPRFAQFFGHVVGVGCVSAHGTRRGCSSDSDRRTKHGQGRLYAVTIARV